MKRNTIKDHVKAAMVGLAAPFVFAGAIAVGCCAIEAAVYLPAVGLEAAAEAVANSPRQTQRARLIEKDTALLLGMHGELAYGTFRTEDGRDFKAYDSMRALDGKFFWNTVIPGMEIGRTYEVETVGSEKFGYKIVSAK